MCEKYEFFILCIFTDLERTLIPIPVRLELGEPAKKPVDNNMQKREREKKKTIHTYT